MVVSQPVEQSVGIRRALVPYGLGVTGLDLLAHWNLSERPFEPTWDSRFFFPSRQHDEALSRLEFLAGEQTMLFGMLTGEFGCGKTITRAVFAGQLDPQFFDVVVIENSSFSFTDMLGLAMERLGADPSDLGRTKFARYGRFERMLERITAAGRHVVLVFDEAQEMSVATLNELKLLTNLNSAGRSLLTLILIGQPELRAHVAKLPALEQRISLNFHLSPLSSEESAAYLRHRLQVAGHPTGEIFAPDALQRIFEISQGIPRELNRVTKLAMEFAWVGEQSEVTVAAVDAAARDRQPQQKLLKA